MKKLIKLVLLILFSHTSHAQSLQIGDWQQLKIPASIGGTALIDEIYKGRIYARNGYQGYSSTNQGLSWQPYNNNSYYASSVRIKKIGGRLLSFGARAIILKDYGTETWADTFVYMFSNNNVFTDQIHALLPHKDSVLAIGTSRSNLSMDTLYVLKADTITWNFKQIAINVPHSLIITPFYGLNAKAKGDSLFMCYSVINPNYSLTFFTTMSGDGGRNWKTVCMGSDYSLTLQGNMLYTINKVVGDSLAVFRRNLPDTSITVLQAGMTRKSFPLNSYSTKLYTHKNKVYMNGLDGVFYLNGIVWQKIGIWPPNSPWNVWQLYFEDDTIWATTSSGLFRYTPQSPIWELRGNGLENIKDMQLTSVKDNRVLSNLSDNSKSFHALSDNNGESPSLVLDTDFLPGSSYALHSSDKIVGYDNRLRRSNNNGLTWETSNTALPANQKSYGMVRKSSYLFISLTQNGIIYRSDDGGQTWIEKNNGKPLGFLPYNELFLVNDVLYQYRGWSLFRSADDGENWTKCNFTNTIVFAKSGPAHYGNEVFLCLENSSDYFHSADNGLTWTKKAMPAYIGNIVFNIGNELFFMKQDYPVGKIYRYTGDINNTVYVADAPYPRWINKIAHNDSLLYISEGTNGAKVHYAPYKTLLPTSIKDNVNRSITVSLYPNPASGAATLELPANTHQAAISIFDVLGKVHYQVSIEQERKVVLPLQGMATGLYFVRVQTPQGSAVKRLAVKE